MDKRATIDYWLNNARIDRKAAQKLFEAGCYHWSLFLWHIVLEKTLKARIVQLGKPIPHIHDLLWLSKEAGLNSDERSNQQLNEITTFNIEARYDDYKQSFYKKANKKFATSWVDICDEIYHDTLVLLAKDKKDGKK